MRITDRPTVRAGEFSSHWHTPGSAQQERHVHDQRMIITGLVVDDQVTEGDAVVVGAVGVPG
jgi:hypothetical protein